jgi:adenylate kinase family enzyme
MTRNYFAGANTPLGFYSNFERILSLQKTSKKIYIKGGSGTGKSTLMKKTAEIFEKKNYDTECFYCSNDAESVDGICVPALRIAVVDATSPHPADPFLPYAVDEIFNTAEFLDRDFLRSKNEILRELLTEKKTYYERAYGYLRAANEVYKLNEKIYQKAKNSAVLNSLIFELLRVFDEMKPSKKTTWERQFFATAITPEGVKNLINSALDAERTYILGGTGAMGITELLATVQRHANLLGLDTVSFKSPLAPEVTEHLHIPALDTAFITSNKYHKTDDAQEINFKEFLSAEKYETEISYNDEVFDELLQRSIKTMAASKAVHAKIEETYAEAMDFKRMNRAYDRVLEWLSD